VNAQSLHALTDPELLAARHAWERRLQDLFDGRLADTPFYLQGISCSGKTDMYDDPARRAREALEEIAEQAGKVKDPKVFRPPTVSSGVHGVHFVDRIFGAKVYELHGEEGNWQAEYLASPVGTLETPDLEADPTWQALAEFARTFTAGGVTVPVFQLPTIASVLNIALNLYGQRLLEAMMADPSAARRDLEVINAVLLYMHDWYRANIPTDLLQHVASTGRHQPPGHGQICGCSTHLLSGDQYREFIAAHDDAILSRYPKGGMIHLCGCHTQHIGAWREMRSLKAIQLNDRAAEDLEIYLQEIPEKVYYVNPCEGMPLERVERLARTHKIVVVAEPAAEGAGK
jgi:hypothetical protein